MAPILPVLTLGATLYARTYLLDTSLTICNSTSMEIPKLSAKEAEVLRLLIANGEMYGLEMVQRSSMLKRGTVYVTLSRMGDKGYVESRLEDISPGDGPPRRLYKATGVGIRAYRAMELAARVFLGGEVAWGS